MRIRGWTILMTILTVGGCGDDDARSGHEDGEQKDGEQQDGEQQDGGPDRRSYGETMARVQAWVAEYDRMAAATCPCLLATGAYPDMEACIEALGAGEAWVTCVTDAAFGYDAGVGAETLLEQFECSTAQVDLRATCFEEAGCEPEAFAACNDLQADAEAACGMFDADLLVYVLEACPDTGLLSR